MFQEFKLTFVLVLYMGLCLESHAASDICSICRCKDSQKTLDCSFKELKSIPQSIPLNVEHLNLFYNKIKEIKAEMFENFSNLKSLNLSYNEITEIKSDTFRNLSSLKNLALSHIGIKEIKPDIFQNLSSLEIIDLSWNNIEEIKAETFRNLSSLTILYLYRNKIKEIKGETFQDLYNLKILNFHKNDITKIEVETFQNLHNLKTLDFHSNRIQEIKAETFWNLSSLTILDFHINQIKEIDVETFQNLSRLEFLYMHQNYIQEIKAKTFQTLSSLKHLALNSNELKEIREDTFHNMSNLVTIDLKKNAIREIKSETFRNLTNLINLILSHNKIAEIKVDTFQGLSSLKYLNLKVNQITDIKPKTFQNLSKLNDLYLGRNSIKEIAADTFRNLSSLNILDLGGNNIEKIKVETFQSLSKIRWLYLGRNSIKEIAADTFRNLSSLDILDLGGNNIEKIKVETFQSLSKVRMLYLDYNHLKGIEVGTFGNLSSLQTLILRGNDITEIAAETFQNNSKLSLIYLSDNKIKGIGAETFQNIPSLIHLDLKNNDISEISSEAFQNHPGLMILYLSSNNITEIKPDTFRNITKLRYLDLDFNNITEIQSATFQNLPWLQKLNLSSNQIQDYEDGAFLFLPNINSIDLRNNKDMKCECHLPALVNYTRSVLGTSVSLQGECQTDPGNNQSKIIPIMEYSQCQNYSLFQRNLQCQTCSEVMCNDPDVTNCTGDEHVCRIKLSKDGIKMKYAKTCSTYKNCLDGLRNNPLGCKKSRDSSCISCCAGNLCNNKDFVGWGYSFQFHLIFNSTSDKGKYVPPDEVLSAVMTDKLSNLTGTFKVKHCGSERYIEAFTITCTLPSKVPKDQIIKEIVEIFKTSKVLRHIGFQQQNMKLVDEIICDQNTLTSNNGIFYWPITKAGTNATISCYANVATRRCDPIDSSQTEIRECFVFSGQWREPDMSQCHNREWITQQLKNVTTEDINKENVKEISSVLRTVSKKSLYFEPEDVDMAVEIHEKMLPFISNMSANVTVKNIFSSISDLINTPEEVLIEAEKSKGAVKRLLNILDSIPAEIPLEEKQQLTAIYSNLSIGVIKVEKDSFNGAVYAVSFGNKETEANTMIHNNSDSDPQINGILNSISLPKSLLKHLKAEERTAVSRVSFFSMRDDKLYRVIQKSSTKANTKIKSNIIGANVPKTPVKGLDLPVNISFNLTDQKPARLRCVYWDESAGQDPHWSEKGCKTSLYVPGEKMVCSCDHLTSFALMDIDQKISHFLTVTSYIGCGISFVCLVFTVIIHLCFKDLRKLMASKILINLCISLAITNFIFLVGMQPYALKISNSCKTVAVFLHYFLLTSLMWMAVESLHLFKCIKSFMLKTSILAWGLPGVIVIITLAINNTNNYITIAKVCWLSKTPFYVAFLAPVVIILICSFTMLFLVLRRLTELKSEKKFENDANKMRVFGIFVLMFLFVLSWLLAFIAVEEEAGVFDLLFIIFNIMSGIFIVIFYCFCMKDARDVTCSLCVQKRNEASISLNQQNKS